MAQKITFKRNAKNIGRLLKTWDGGKREAAAKILAQMNDPEAKIEIYETDREVVGVMIPADTQAKRGGLTKAANTVGGS